MIVTACCASIGHSQFDFKEGRFYPLPHEVNYCWPLANNWPGAGNKGESGLVIIWLVGDKESWLELLRKVFFQNLKKKGRGESWEVKTCAMPSPFLPAFSDLV